MCFNASIDCPYCPESTRPSALSGHVAQHEESTRLHVEMKVSANLTVVLERTSGKLYACPVPQCATLGSIGTVWEHYRAHHLPTKRVASQTPNPREYKRARYPSPESPHSFVPPTYPAPPAYRAAPATYPAPPDIHLNLESIINRRQSVDGVYTYVANSMSNILHVCPYDVIMTGVGDPFHSQLFQCSETRMTSRQSEYMNIFRPCLRYGKKPQRSVCYVCYCPQFPAFASHPVQNRCSMDQERSRELWKHIWFSLGYLVFRIPLLREQVFQELGIAKDSFKSILHYAIWLLQTAYPEPTQAQSQLTNLVVVANAYFTLCDDGRLKRPAKGFVFPELN
ncbi:hypothetical protein BDP27DRAFT_1430487 [Rhodocollybia butyracea]|uniref:Uncharacterized protein n=1 Tax=Rhodocollybia butyracea TaxID=206335 RepID=A0A9P5TZ85_9AGAR|nr:hypothetical protein BDP27DRAFT_1430487 [Rhodocollybia butyracea]